MRPLKGNKLIRQTENKTHQGLFPGLPRLLLRKRYLIGLICSSMFLCGKRFNCKLEQHNVSE